MCILDNFIDGKEFVALKENEVKELIAPLGIVKKILRLIPTQDLVSMYMTHLACTCILW